MECGDGRFYDAVTRACEACSRGTYKGPSDPVCQDCPVGQTTESTGSTDAAQCNLREFSLKEKKTIIWFTFTVLTNTAQFDLREYRKYIIDAEGSEFDLWIQSVGSK